VRVVVTGGTGFLGLGLARRLLERATLTGPGGGQEPIERLVLLDHVLPSARPDGLDERGELVEGDVAEPGVAARLVGGGDVSVFHLASVVSGQGEIDFDLALRVNLDGGRAVLEACRAAGPGVRLVFASTAAVFGGAAMPAEVADTTKQTPETTYGATKAVCELLVNDYTRKGFLDGRTARLPTVIVRPGAPNAAASSFASAVFREPLAGRDYALPVGLDVRMPVIGARTAVDCLVALHELPPDALGHDRAVNLPSLSVTVGEMVESVRRVGDGRPLGRIDVVPDPAVEAICRTWPGSTRFERALALRLPADESLDAIARAYLEDAGEGRG
jgi:nucleoside-diphosphate-sugar epimerase